MADSSPSSPLPPPDPDIDPTPPTTTTVSSPLIPDGKVLKIILERLPEDLVSTRRGRRTLLRRLLPPDWDSEEEEEAYNPRPQRRERKRVERYGEFGDPNSSHSEGEEEESERRESWRKRRKEASSTKSSGRSKKKTSRKKEKRRKTRLAEDEASGSGGEGAPSGRSTRNRKEGVKYNVDDSGSDVEEVRVEEGKEVTPPPSKPKRSKPSTNGDADAGSDWSGGSAPPGSSSSAASASDDSDSDSDSEAGGGGNSSSSSDFTSAPKKPKQAKQSGKKGTGRGAFINEADDFENIEDGFQLELSGSEGEEDGNLSEISIPSEEEEEEAPPVDLEAEEEGKYPEASTINNNKEQNGKEDEKEALPSSQWTMEEEKVEKETPTEGTEPGADGVLPLGPDSRFPEDREERARRKRLEYILKRSEFYTKKLTTGGAAIEGGGKAKVEAKGSGNNRRKKRKQDDADLYLTEEASSTNSSPTLFFDSSPGYITGGEMRDYQVRGLNWLIQLYENGINGILADEMGLGKTLQSISLLGYLKHVKGLQFHAIVIVPKSTLSNWENEVARWCPSLRTLALIGDQEQRRKLLTNKLRHLKKWDVLLTTYEMVYREKTVLKKIRWGYLIIDEAHRIKNEKALLSQTVRTLKSRHRLLLTGTPLQNNLHELWALLNFLLPEAFSSHEDFDSWFQDAECLESEGLVKRLHTILRPFLLRRLKSDVEKGLAPKKELKLYVPLTQMQKQCYKNVLLNQFDVLTSQGTVARKRLSNVIVHLRKCCNHPYLFEGQEPGPPYECGDHLFTNCGKLLVMDKLLTKLQREGSRVLVFTSMARMLDILEDYCYYKEYKYHRLDGQTDYADRQSRIDEFNSPGSETFLFMMTTKAGGLGINLATADTVIIYDSDWNPQVDLQAMDRCHRIGQTKEVRVFRLITENTVEERIVQRAAMKLKLDKVVIQQGRTVDKSQNTLSSNDIISWIRFGAKTILSDAEMMTTLDEGIEEIISRSKAKGEEADQVINSLPENKLRSFTIDTAQEEEEETDYFNFEGEDFRKQRLAYMRSQNYGKPRHEEEEVGDGKERASKRKAKELFEKKEKESSAQRRKRLRMERERNQGNKNADVQEIETSSDSDPASSSDGDDWSIRPDAKVGESDSEDDDDHADAKVPLWERPFGYRERKTRQASTLNLSKDQIAAQMQAAVQARMKKPPSLPDSELRKLCTFLPGSEGNIKCNLCTVILRGHGNISKFRRHYERVHNSQKPMDRDRSRTSSLTAQKITFPASIRTVEDLSKEQLMGYFTPLPKDGNKSKVMCKVCKKVLQPGLQNIYKLRKHFRIHFRSQNDEEGSNNSNDVEILPVPAPVKPVQLSIVPAQVPKGKSWKDAFFQANPHLQNISTEFLHQYCTFLSNKDVRCNVCATVLTKGTETKITIFRRHFLSYHLDLLRESQSEQSNNSNDAEIEILPVVPIPMGKQESAEFLKANPQLLNIPAQDLYQYCTFNEKCGVHSAKCNLCGKVYLRTSEVRMDKFRRHFLASHLDVLRGTLRQNESPEEVTISDSNEDNDNLPSDIEILPNGSHDEEGSESEMLIPVDPLSINVPEPLPLTEQDLAFVEEHSSAQQDPLAGTLPESPKTQPSPSEKETEPSPNLRQHYILLPNKSIKCRICKKVLKVQGDYEKYAEHYNSVHAE